MTRRATAAAIVLAASPAGANGRPPATVSIELAPGDPDRIVVGATFGALVTQDGGATWHWICEAAIDYVGKWDPEFLVEAGGAVVAATTANRGISVTDDAGCNWERRGGDWKISAFSDLERRDDGAWIVSTASAGRPNAVLLSLDRGRTLVPTGLASDEALFRDLLVGPGGRVWAIGYTLDTDGLRVHRSDDGAETWTATGITAADFNLFGLAADPADASRFYYQLQEGRGWPTRRGVADGDASEPVFEFEGGAAATALATSSDGQTIVIGHLGGAVVRSDDGGASFGAVASPLHVRCLATQDDVLWSCANDDLDGFAIARSLDFGDSWTPVLRLADLSGPLPCPAGSDVAERCLSLWPGLCEQLGIDDPSCAAPPAPDAGPDAGMNAGPDASPDAGTVHAPAGWRAQGGGCSVAGGAGAAGAILAATLRRGRSRPRSPGRDRPVRR